MAHSVYARVASQDRKANSERRKQVLELYCARHGRTFELTSDFGLGMNDRKIGRKQLLAEILEGDVGRLVVTLKDRLLRFVAKLAFAACEATRVEVVILNHGESTRFDADLAKDVLEIATLFSARLHGGQSSRGGKKLVGLANAMEDAETCC